MDQSFLPRIDAHAHWELEGAKLADGARLLGEWGVRVNNVVVATEPARCARMRRVLRAMHETRPQTFAWTTSFDASTSAEAGFARRVTQQLDEDFAAGAVGVKIWRNVGMFYRKADGTYLMMDDPAFHPIYEHIAQRGRTLLVHVNEPKLRWLSPDERQRKIGTYREPPNYPPLSEAERPAGCPGYEAQNAACDRVLAAFPNLRVVGAHLASNEHDLPELGRRLDRYPNLAVDTSGRRRDIAAQDRQTVTRFVQKYQDRILWGMDQGGAVTAENAAEKWPYIERSNRDGYHLEFALYETAGDVTIDRQTARGLQLPDDLLVKLYRDNAQRWYPGMFPA